MQLEKERDVAAAAKGELDARMAVRATRAARAEPALSDTHALPLAFMVAKQDKEEAEARLARLQVEHLDVVQRFMNFKAAESERVRLHALTCPASGHQAHHDARASAVRLRAPQLNEIQKLHEEVATARAAAAAAAAAAALAGVTAPSQPGTPSAVASSADSALPSLLVEDAAAGGAAEPAAPQLPSCARHTLRANAGATHALSFSPNCVMLATAGEDKVVNVRPCSHAF